MARFKFRLPDIGEGISEAEIVSWRVQVGDRVEEDQELADMMTDKATVAMESPVSGTVIELAGAEGDMVPIGSTLVVIEVESDREDAAPGEDAANDATEATKPPSSPGKSAITTERPEEARSDETADTSPDEPLPKPNSVMADATTAKPVLASPAVRARARDLGVDLSHVKATGDHIRHADLDAFLRYESRQGYRASASGPARPDETVKVMGLRRRIAENMAASKRNIPHFTYVEEMDVTALEAMRADLNAARGDRPKLTLLPMLIVAICKALPDFPMINAAMMMRRAW